MFAAITTKPTKGWSEALLLPVTDISFKRHIHAHIGTLSLSISSKPRWLLLTVRSELGILRYYCWRFSSIRPKLAHFPTQRGKRAGDPANEARRPRGKRIIASRNLISNCYGDNGILKRYVRRFYYLNVTRGRALITSTRILFYSRIGADIELMRWMWKTYRTITLISIFPGLLCVCINAVPPVTAYCAEVLGIGKVN